ncbi:MAG: outer membrane protein assembly factor BamE [Burkholderiaceae bacterium]
MRKWLMIGWLCSMLGALGACDFIASKELRPGESTVDDVRRLMGGPDTIREFADGSKRYEYPRGPAGSQTWMVNIDASGRYQSMYDALAEANLARVRPGMSRDAVRELLGRPAESGRMAGFEGLVMTWRVQTGPGLTEMFHVEFDAREQVVRVDRSADPDTINLR